MTDAPTNTEVVRANSVADLNQIITALGGRAGILSTLPQGTQAERIAVAAAVSNALAIDENLGKTIEVVHVIVQAVEMTNEQTGEIQLVPRVIFYDNKGVGYAGMSGPLFRDVRTMLGLIGDPQTWTEPVKIKVIKEGTGTRKYFALQYV